MKLKLIYVGLFWASTDRTYYIMACKEPKYLNVNHAHLFRIEQWRRISKKL